MNQESVKDTIISNSRTLCEVASEIRQEAQRLRIESQAFRDLSKKFRKFVPTLDPYAAEDGDTQQLDITG